MMNKTSSYSADSLTAPYCHGHSFPCSSSAPCNNYQYFLRFWGKLYGPLRLGLGTKARLWSQFQIYLRILHFFRLLMQPVPENMRLEMVIRIQNEILDGHHRFLFKWLIWKENLTFTIEDFVLYSEDHFEFQSHLPVKGLYCSTKGYAELFLPTPMTKPHRAWGSQTPPPPPLSPRKDIILRCRRQKIKYYRQNSKNWRQIS